MPPSFLGSYKLSIIHFLFVFRLRFWCNIIFYALASSNFACCGGGSNNRRHSLVASRPKFFTAHRGRNLRRSKSCRSVSHRLIETFSQNRRTFPAIILLSVSKQAGPG